MAAVLIVPCELFAGWNVFQKNAGNSAPASPSSAAAPTSASTTTGPGMLAQQGLIQRSAATINAIQAMQAAARAAVLAANAPKNAGTYAPPSNPKQTVPLLNVPDGMASGDGVTTTGGLVPDSGLSSNGTPNPVTTWTGANTPTQSTSTSTAGTTQTTVTVTQTASTAVLNWQSFNVGRNTTLDFDQSLGGANVGQWVAFNKIGVTGAPSQILGSIQAQGQVYVINPNGIIFGGSSQVNTQGFLASALPINDNLINRGLLNNPDAQFLFSALALPAGTQTPAFTPAMSDPVLPAATASTGGAYTTALALASGTVPVLTVPAGSADSSPTTLVVGRDYQVTANTNGTATVSFLDTPPGPVTVSYTPVPSQLGNVVVQPGAQLSTPLAADHVGGRIALVGPNVTNQGTISTPDGQTILAAGLQVAFDSHPSDDPTLRGLDVYVGAVNPTNPAGAAPAGMGVATNDGQSTASGLTLAGVINAPRGDVTLAGAVVNQLGIVNSSTSVSYNGRVDLLAEYGSIGNSLAAAGASPDSTPLFVPALTGAVNLGPYSVTQILPETSSTDTIVGTQLALPSLVDITGLSTHLASAVDGNGNAVPASGAILLAPNAGTALNTAGTSTISESENRTFLTSGVTMNMGDWILVTPNSQDTKDLFTNDQGQIYMDSGTAIDVSGSENVMASVDQDVIAVQLRGPQLANSPVQQNGALRGQTVDVDIRQYGTFNGQAWVGTPVGDTSGYVALIERSVGELTTQGGTISMSAGNSVVMQPGATVNVSGGWTNFQGGSINTTEVVSAGKILNIADATPDLVYSGIHTGATTTTDAKWGVTQSTSNPIPSAIDDPGFIQGGSGGSLSILSPSMSLEGNFYGNTAAGTYQRTTAGQVKSEFATDASLIPTMQGILAAPNPGSVALTFNGNPSATSGVFESPTPPNIVFKNASPIPVAAFDPTQLQIPGSAGQAGAEIDLSPDLVNLDGVGNLKVDVSGGQAEAGASITVPQGTALNAAPGSVIVLKGANVTVDGSIVAPAGTIDVEADAESTVGNSPTNATSIKSTARGNAIVGPGATLSTAGLIVDDRPQSPTVGALPMTTNGGAIVVDGLTTEILPGSTIDASGGLYATPTASLTYGTGGSISIAAGLDPAFSFVSGGQLMLDPTSVNLRGYAGPGVKGATLTIQAPLVQVGGSSLANGDTLSSGNTFWVNPTDGNGQLLGPDFFSQGGFSHYQLTGVGMNAVDASGKSISGEFLPAVYVASGAAIEPVAASWLAKLSADGSSFSLAVDPETLPAGQREAAGVSLTALGTKDPTTQLAVIMGNVVLGANSLIETDPQPSGGVSLKGNTVAVLGDIVAPSGSVSIAGANDSTIFLFGNGAENAPFASADENALPTVDLAPGSLIDVSGTTVLVPNIFGLRTGSVLPGGNVSIAGNILAESGSTIDVSGATDRGDPAGLLYFPVNTVSGSASSLLNPLSQYVPAAVDSNAGQISIAGSHELYLDATLIGEAGGPTAQGGAITVTSGLFVPPAAANENLPLTTPGLVVVGSGPTIPSTFQFSGASAVGQLVNHGVLAPELGHVSASSLTGGGFDSIALSSSDTTGVQFDGSVSLTANRSLIIGGDGVIDVTPTAEDPNPVVSLGAAYVEIGQPFNPPSSSPTSGISGTIPTTGPGTFKITASDLVDIGDTSFQGIGTADISALQGGSIRGDGTFDLAGALTLDAAQIYPTTAGRFMITAYDAPGGGGGTTDPGTVTIVNSSSAPLPQVPLSAGGELDVYATDIVENGVLRAPIGTINLGWNGPGTGSSGSAPVDLNTGSSVPVTKNLTLGAGSLVSVSASDPTITEIPYGINVSGTSWIDPVGNNITISGVPHKSVTLAAANITTDSGSAVNVSGGGDLYAYQWISGNGGTNDVLSPSYVPNPSSPTLVSFAVLPGYQPNYAPYAPYATATVGLGTDPGYVANVNAGTKLGDQVFLNGGDGLATGVYTVLPARYALLPGAFLVTPVSGKVPSATDAQTDGSALVTGYQFNGLEPLPAEAQPLLSSFDVATGTPANVSTSPATSVVRSRSQYADYLATAFISQSALAADAAVPQLPYDGGQVVLSATSTISLEGGVQAQAAHGGSGGTVDISSPLAITIGTFASNSDLVLNPADLSQLGAGSLLIGGVRSDTANGVQVAVTTPSITVDNAGAPLTGSDIILAATGSITLDQGSDIEQVGTLTGPAQILNFGQVAAAGQTAVPGDGSVVRVSSDPSAQIVRQNLTGSTAPSLVVGAGSKVMGASVTLDSTSNTSLNSAAVIGGAQSVINLDSGQISLQLPGAGPLRTQPVGGKTTGLVLSGDALQSIESSASSLSLLSYSSIDIYGSGSVGASSFSSISLHAPEIFGDGGNAEFSAKTIELDNASGRSGPDPATVVSSQGLTGSLTFDSTNLIIGSNPMAVDQYLALNLNATGSVLLENSGGITTQGNLAMTASQIGVALPPSSSASGAPSSTVTQTYVAGGTVTVATPSGSSSGTASNVLGATLSFTGQSVAINAPISIPSGSIQVHATGQGGSVTIGSSGVLSVGGSQQTIGTTVEDSSAGSISLTSDDGNVEVASGAELNLAAQPDGGSGGALTVSAPDGEMSLATGSALGQAGIGGNGGSFSLDAKGIAGSSNGSLSALGQLLASGGFDDSLDLRLRNGGVLVDGTLAANTVSISADQGSIEVTGSGKIDASGATGGSIGLFAGGNLTLDSGSLLTVQGQNFNAAGKGGSVVLQAGAPNVANPASNIQGMGPQLNILGGSTIDLSIVNDLPLLLNTAGSSITMTAKVPVAFPTGTPGDDEVTFGSAGVLTTVNGVSVSFGAGYTAAVAPGSTVVLSSTGSIAFAAGGTGGSVPLSVRVGSPISEFNVTDMTPVYATGTLTLVAPQAVDAMTGTMPVGVQIGPINGTIISPSSILVQGEEVFAPVGGLIDGVEGVVAANGAAFASTSNTNSIVAGLTAHWGGGSGQVNPGLSTTPDALVHVQPGAEIVNTTAPTTLLLGSGKAQTTLVPGASVTLNPGTAITDSNGTGLVNGTSVVFNAEGSGSGGLFVSDGSSLAFPIGTQEQGQVQFSTTSSTTLTGTILSGGTSTPFTISSSSPFLTALLPGSVVSLSGPYTVTYASGSSAIPIYLSNGTYATAGIGTTTVTNYSGALTLANTWDLSALRFGPNAVTFDMNGVPSGPIGSGEPGALTLRSAGNINFLYDWDDVNSQVISIASLSDGFDPTSSLLKPIAAGSGAIPSPSAEWTAPLLAAGSSSWSFKIVSGADLTAANPSEVEPLAGAGSLPAGAGSVQIGLGAQPLQTNFQDSSGRNLTSEELVPLNYQTIRTGTGDISIDASQDILLLNSLATVYTAGTQAPALSDFQVPLSKSPLGNPPAPPIEQPLYPVLYSFGGGDVALTAQGDIAHEIQTLSGLEADSSLEMPTDWLYRRGATNSAGVFASLTKITSAVPTANFESTSWWVNFSNFFEGVGALGGGNVTLSAGHDIENVDAVVPTNARMTGLDSNGNALSPANATLIELGGGDLSVTAGNNLNGGVYYVERGTGTFFAGNQILTNATRSTLDPNDLSVETNVEGGPDPITELPTTFFLGQGSLSITAGGSVDLGAIANPFLLPQGTDNGFFNKSYFSTYAITDSVNVDSLSSSVTLKDSPGQTDGSLIGWYTNVIGNTTLDTFANEQPWLTLVESDPSNFSSQASLMPSTLNVVTFSGDINVVGQATLAPSPTGNLSLLADGSINGTQKASLLLPFAPFNASSNPYEWFPSILNLSDASLSLVPGPASPLGLSSFLKSDQEVTQGAIFNAFDQIFAPSGATSGPNVLLQTEQALHGELPDQGGTAEPLHASDPNPVQVVASRGDLSGITLFSGKAADVVAAADITDVGLYVQNVAPSDITVVSAGRDILAYDPTSPLRLEAQQPGNEILYQQGSPLVLGSGSPDSGDIQVAGPGTLEVFAGRNLALGSGGPAPNQGIGVGITTVGNTLNPLLPFSGASIVTAAGVGTATELSSSQIDFSSYIAQYLDPASAPSESLVTLPELGQIMNLTGASDSQVWSAFEDLPIESQDLLALDSFYLVLRDAGRNRNNPDSASFGNYNTADAAIASLFPGKGLAGSITMNTRKIETTNGGDIAIVTPGGGVTVGFSSDPQTPDQGILTEQGGNISIFSNNDVSLGTSRIFTLQGGNVIIWSSQGNIAAGSGSKTLFSAPPTRVLIDPQSANVENDPAGLATGSGIGVLATLTGVAPGSVDLIAPIGTIDAGDAGIRASGSINIAALHVLNASNIQSGGATTGVPVVATPNIGGLASASTSSAAASAAASQVAGQQSAAQTQQTLIPSIISVEVLGYGGGDDFSYAPGSASGTSG